MNASLSVLDAAAVRGAAAAIRKSSGFTLMELVVVVAVVAILAAIAVPGYNEQVRKTRRSEATAQLMEIAQALERFHTINGTYVRVPPATNEICNRTTQYYTITCSALEPTRFALQAVPAGAQVGDKCGIYMLNQAGLRSVDPNQPGLTVADCW